MNDELKKIVESLPLRPPRSRLSPYAELIAEMRTRGWTYRAIAKVLAEKCGVRASPSNVHHFVRNEQGKGAARREEQPVSKPMLKVPVRSTASLDVNQRIAALKQRPSLTNSTEVRFEFDPDEPLRLNTASARDEKL